MTIPDGWQEIVRRGYNQVAHRYQRDRSQLSSHNYLMAFLKLLPSKSSVLDIGCGSGTPIAGEVLKKGHLLTGIDISQTQVAHAKQKYPQGAFLLGDIAKLQAHQYEADGVIMLYSLFHVPRELHGGILKVVASFLPKGGPLFITMGDRDFEGMHEFYGVKMWSSHYGPAKNRALLQDAGFDIEMEKIDGSGAERHHMILAIKFDK